MLLEPYIIYVQVDGIDNQLIVGFRSQDAGPAPRDYTGDEYDGPAGMAPDGTIEVRNSFKILHAL